MNRGVGEVTAFVCALLLSHRSLSAQSGPLITGRAVDARTGAALGNVSVALSDGARTTSAPDGSYRLRALEPGSFILEARRPGFAMASRAVSLANGQTLSVQLAMTPIPVELLVQRVTADALRSTPGSTVLTRADIERSGARDIGELLRGQPGITLVPRGGPGSPVTVSIRGSSADQVLVLLDGIPINNPISGEADLSALDPAAVERVDIVRGAQSSRYGGQALGGVILLATRHARNVTPQLSLGGGQWGDRRLGVQSGGHATADDRVLSANGGVSWQQTRGDFVTGIPPERGGGTTRRTNADARRVTLNAGGSVERDGTTLDVRTELSDVERGMPGSIVQPSQSARQTQRRVGVTGTLTGTPRETVALRAALGVQHQTGRFSDPAPPFGTSYDLRQGVTSAVASLDATTALRQYTLLAGVEARRLDVAGNALSDSAARGVTYGGAWTAVSRAFQPGAWLLSVGSGARLDIGTLWSGAYLSPDLHATAQRGIVRIAAAWHSAFSAPSLGDLFFQEGVQVRANPALRPERVRGEWTTSLDVDRVTRSGVRTTFALSGFRGDIDDLILWSPDFRFIWRPDNFNVSRRGIETSMRIALASNAAALTITGNGTDIRYRGPVLEGQVIYRPRVTASAVLDLPVAGTDMQLAVQHTGTRRTVVGSDINQLRAFDAVQARVARQFDVGPLDARLRLSVENLLDQRIAMLLDYPMPGRTFALDITLRPQTRRPLHAPVPASRSLFQSNP